VSAHTCGTAAGHILAGHIGPDGIDAAMAACAWCQQPRGNRECWHADARVLLAQGLRPLPAPPAPGDRDEGTLFPVSGGRYE
jgi:hypothetical protein